MLREKLCDISSRWIIESWAQRRPHIGRGGSDCGEMLRGSATVRSEKVELSDKGCRVEIGVRVRTGIFCCAPLLEVKGRILASFYGGVSKKLIDFQNIEEDILTQ